jgi:hypothetical protein
MGTVDPIFMYELALELGMTVKDLGRRADLHELAVGWPEFFAYRARERERQERKERSRRR